MIEHQLLYRHLRVHGNTFNAFLQGQNQERCDNVTYPRAYLFLERLRIHFGKPKTCARLFNEKNYPDGFSLKKVVKNKTSTALYAAITGDHDGLC